MWASPEMRRLSFVSSDSALRSPTRSAAATAPASPGSRRHDARDDGGADARDEQIGDADRRVERLPLTEHETAAADPVEIGGAARIVSARDDRTGDGHHASANGDAASKRRQAVFFRKRKTDAIRHVRRSGDRPRQLIEDDSRTPLLAILPRDDTPAQLRIALVGDVRRVERSVRSFAAVAPAASIATIAAKRHTVPRV